MKIFLFPSDNNIVRLQEHMDVDELLNSSQNSQQSNASFLGSQEDHFIGAATEDGKNLFLQYMNDCRINCQNLNYK